MGILMINCPSTGRVVSTGIELCGVDQLPTVIATIQCSVCGCVHEWTKHNAWLAEDGEQYRDVAVGKTAANVTNGHRTGAPLKPAAAGMRRPSWSGER